MPEPGQFRVVSFFRVAGVFARAILTFLVAASVTGCADVPPTTSTTPLCDAGFCVCTTDQQCTGGYRCDPDKRACVQCLGDGDCAAGLLCVAAKCAMGCSAQHGCGDAGVCEVDAGVCVPCNMDTDCRDAARPNCDLSQHRCVPCLPSPDYKTQPEQDRCASRLYCVATGGDYACVAGCKSDADCSGDGGSSLRCDLSRHQCANCAADDDCPAGKLCRAGVCVDGCTDQHACDVGTCCAGACVDVKSSTDHCGACGMACQGGWSCCNAACSNPTDDVANCGGCGISCSVSNGLPACVARKCAVASCTAGWANCNMAYADGCEIDILTNANNCGACGNACSLAHSSSKCVAGACAVDTCIGFFADCDKLATNGCELDTSQDSSNCGGCGKACALPHASPVCAAGQCKIASCDSGWSDCNNNPLDGCEVHTDVDPVHCGSCARACSSANGTATCAGGMCTIMCSMGFANCDGDAGNGCEVGTQTSGQNCGGCGITCNLPNATPSCNAGACIVSGCGAGYADCNRVPGDGCEVQVSSDAKNCGACGNACSQQNGVGSCSGGACRIQCSFGYGDCNMMVGDGCEASFATDVRNCGACGLACNLANATAACAAGSCKVASCASGYVDCDGMAQNGCEVSVTSDVRNCGGCGVLCSNNNASATCVNGGCRLSCTAGFADCNMLASDGCEKNLYADAQNCGSCGTVCSTNNIFAASCANGVCNGACDPGWYDCNGNKQVDGCESATATDPMNCGACGTICSSSHISMVACSASVCSGACDSGWGDCNSNKQVDGCETATGSDPKNCGACGNACATGENCINGYCTVSCSPKINEVQTGGAAGGLDEFVEIYNSCATDIDLNGWILAYRSAAGTSENVYYKFPTVQTMLASGGYYLIAQTAWTGTATRDGTATGSGLAAAGGGLGLRDATMNIVDSVGWGTATNLFVEGQVAPAPMSAQTIARTSTSQDTNNNANDFKIQSTPTPRAINP